ncbi:MFS transporter [Angustibacter sp. McL0619]|uniref:MFS transporter n=1 Tax=Angustibacter sp. McL0619 TaxID=3415676 RepID=UPI003CF77CD2
MASSRGLAIGVLVFASFMDLMDATIVNVALPSIRADLQATPAQLEWTVGGYLLAFAVLMITGGRLGDIFGRQRIFVIGVLGFTVGSTLACVAPSADVLVAARVLQGAFAALMVPQTLSSVQALFSPRERAPIYGVIGAVSGLSAVIGPVLGGWMISSDAFGIGWRSVFLINLPIGLVLIVLAVKFVPNTRSQNPLRLDLVGVALASLGLLGVVYPIIEGRQQGWPAWIWAMGAAGVAVLGVFVVQQRRRERGDGSALLPMHLFANRGFSAGLVTQATFQGAMAAFALITVIFLQVGLGFTAMHAGLTLLPFSLGAFVGVGVAVPLGVRVGKLIMVAGGGMQSLAVVWTLLVVRAQGDGLGALDLVPPLLVAGIGLGLLVVPLIDVALATVPTGDAGAASGAYGTVQQVGAALGVAVVGVVFFGVVGTTYTADSLRHALLVAGWVPIAGYAMAALASLLLPARADVLAHVEAQARELELAA